MDIGNLQTTKLEDLRTKEALNENKQQAMDALQSKKEALDEYVTKLGRDAGHIQNAGNEAVFVREHPELKDKKLELKTKLFEAKDKMAKEGHVRKVYHLEDVIREVNGLGATASTKKKASLMKNIRKKYSEKKQLSKAMKETMKKVSVNAVHFEQIQKVSTVEILKRDRSFAKFKYANLSAYKTDKDFQKNYSVIMKELEQRIEEGYTARRYYYEIDMDGKDIEKGLSVMAKTATLERIKDYMQLRAELISNPYYAMNDAKALFSMDNSALENRLREAERRGTNTDQALVAFLSTLISINLLGFKVDGTGRREVEAQILKESKEIWADDSKKINQYTLLKSELEALGGYKRKQETLEKIHDNVVAMKAQLEEKESEREEENPELKEQQAIEEVKQNREEWLKRIEELSKTYKFDISLDTYKENILKHIADGFLTGAIKKEDDQNFLAVLRLYETRIKDKSLQIDSLIEKDESIQLLTCGLESKKELVKKYLLDELIKRDKLLTGDEKLDIVEFKNNKFFITFTDKKMQKNYMEILRRFPNLAKDKRVWDSVVTEKLLGLEESKFEVEMQEMQYQADFYDEIIRSMISNTVKEKKLHKNVRAKIYAEIKSRLGADLYLAPIGQVMLETSRYLNELDLLHIVDMSDLQEWEILENPDVTAEEEKKWKTKKYRNPVDSVKERLFKKLPALSEVFGNSGDIAVYVFNAMTNCSTVIAHYPNIATFENVEDISKLNYRELMSVLNILSDNVIAAGKLFAQMKVTMSPELKKYTLGKMMESSLDEAAMKAVIEEGTKKIEADEKRYAANRKMMLSDLLTDNPSHNKTVDTEVSKALKKYPNFSMQMQLIEMAVEDKYEKQNNPETEQKKAILKQNLKRYATMFKNVANGEDSLKNLRAMKYNQEKFGAETFEEAIALFLDTEDDSLTAMAMQRQQRRKAFAKHNHGALKPVMKQLIGQDEVMRRLLDAKESVDDFAKEMEQIFTPFLEALKKTDHPSYVIDQYFKDNFVVIYDQCKENPGTVDTWKASLDAYAKQLYDTEIEGRGTVHSLMDDAIKYAEYLEKNVGGFKLITMIELKPELFNLIVGDKDALHKAIKEGFDNYNQNLKTIDTFLKEKKIAKDKRESVSNELVKNLLPYMYEVEQGRLLGAAFQNRIEEAYTDYTKKQQEKDVDTEEAKRQQSKLNMELLQSYRKEIEEKKKAGLDTDEDMQKLLKMEKDLQNNPYIYLFANGVKEVRGGENNELVRYTAEQAKKSREKIDKYLKEMRHEEELPESLKRFMAEVAFSRKYSNMHNELRYIIGVYRALSIHYKFGMKEPIANVQDIIERAVVYHYINHKDHSINENGSMIYKHQKETTIGNVANPLNVSTTNATLNAEPQQKTDEELLREYFGEKYKSVALTDEMKETLKKYKEKRAKEKAKKERKEKKAKIKLDKAKAKKLAQEKKYEIRHKNYLIPKLDIVDLADKSKEFERVYQKNLELQKKLADKEVKASALVSEYKFFLKNIQLSMYSMPADEFIAFADKRLKYFEHADKVYEVIEKELTTHYAKQKELELSKPDAQQSKVISADSDHSFELTELQEYFRLQINEELEKGVAFDAEKWASNMKEVLDNEMLHKAMKASSVSYDEKLGRVRFYADQSRLDDISTLIRNSGDKEAIAQFKALNTEEKLLFAAALSIANMAETQEDSPSCGFIEKDGSALFNMESVKEAFAEYVKGNNPEFEVDFSTAMSNLLDAKKSKQTAQEALFHTKAKTVLNMDAFKAAITIVEAAREKKEEVNGPDLLTLGNSAISLAFAAKHSRKQAYEAKKRTSRDMDAFMSHLTELAVIDQSESSNKISTVRKGKNAVHNIVGRINKKALTTRLMKMSDEEKHLFVMLMQDRTVLDYKSEKREEAFENGGIIEHVNESKRALIKAAYLANASSRSELLLPASKTQALDRAMKTILSFQLRDSVEVDGTKETDYVETSVKRDSLMDWELLKTAFDFIDEMKNDAARISAVKKSSDWIAQSGNEKAIAAFEMQKGKLEFGYDYRDFMNFLNSQEIQAEIDDDKQAMLDGFMILSDAQKVLFFRALENRDVLDISKKNSVKNLVLGEEREYVNSAGRYALIDEFVKFARSDNAEMKSTEDMYYNAMKSLLSTQVNDDINFLKASKKDIKDLIAREGIFESSRRSTAIDWELFGNALQFVTRANYEAKITYEDEDLYRTLGNLEANGDFHFNPSFLRRNIHTTGGRFTQYATSRVRSRIKEYIPDSGNLRILLSYVLNTDYQNAVNRSGWLGKKADGETINQKYVDAYKAEQLEKENVKTKAQVKVLTGAYEIAEKEEQTAQEEYESANKSYERAKENPDVTKEDLETLRKEREEKLSILKEKRNIKKTLEKKKSSKESVVAGQLEKIKALEHIEDEKPIEKGILITETKEEDVENGIGLTEKEMLEVFKKNTGLSKYAEMSGVLSAITNSIGINDETGKLGAYVTALQKANDDMVKVIALAKSDKNIMNKIVDADLDSVMGLAIVVSEDVGQEESFQKIKSIYDDVKVIKADMQKTFHAFVSDKSLLEQMSEADISGLLGVIGKHTEIEAFDMLKKAAKDSQKVAGKIGMALSKYKKNKKEAKPGEEKGFIDLEQDIMEQLGVDAMFDIVSDFTEYFTKNEKAPEMIKASKNVTARVSSIVLEILKDPEIRKSTQEKLANAKVIYEEERKALLEKMAAATDKEEKADLNDALKALDKSSVAEIEGYQKALDMSSTNTAVGIAKNVNLADMGKVVSVFLSEDNAIKVEKYSKQMNLIKDQIANLYHDYCEHEDTQEFVSNFNLDLLFEAASLEGEDSKIYLTGKALSGVSKAIKNGMRIYIKNGSGEVKLDGTTLRKDGESTTQKFNEYGELESRTATEVLNQLGIDEAFELAKVVAMFDSSGKSMKYVTATQELKTQVATLVDNVNKVIADGSYENIKTVTDLDGCLNAMKDIMALNDTTGRYAPILEKLNGAVSLKKEITGLYDAMAADGNVLEKLNDLKIDNLMSMMDQFDKDGFVGAMRTILSETKKIYGATYGLYLQGAGFYKSMEALFKRESYDAVKRNVDKIYENFKDNGLVGDKIKAWNESGALTDVVRVGVVVKDSINSFMNIYSAATGLNTLRKEGRGLDVEFKDMDDNLSLEMAQKKQSDAMKGDAFKLTEGEKNKAKSSRERNLFMTKEGVKYAAVNESMEIVAGAINITGAISKVTFDPTGIASGLLKETAELVKFIAKVFTDNNVLDQFFMEGPGKETMESVRTLRMNRGQSVDDKTLLRNAKFAMGLSNTMELRTFVGRNIVTSILYSASEYNPLAGTKSRAQAVLKALKLDSIIGNTDEEAAVKLYNALLGNYGVDVSIPSPTNVFKGDEKLDGIYGFGERPQQTQSVENGLNPA